MFVSSEGSTIDVYLRLAKGDVTRDEFWRNTGARTIFFATFGLRVFETATKTCNTKAQILLKLFRVTYLLLLG